MTDSNDLRALLFRLMVNGIYVAGAVSSFLVGAFGVFVIAAPLIVSPDMLPLAAALGLPIIAICTTYFIFAVRLLYSKNWRHRRYRAQTWILMLLGLCSMWAV